MKVGHEMTDVEDYADLEGRCAMTMEEAPAERYQCYRGRYACPHCGSKNTGTRTIATSERWMLFACSDCKRRFRKSARACSSLSRRLSGLSKLANEFLNERDAP